MYYIEKKRPFEAQEVYMALFTWKDEYSVKVKEIDNQVSLWGGFTSNVPVFLFDKLLDAGFEPFD